MRITIDGHHLDTEKASHHWELDYWDDHNRHTGDVYRSSKGTWYVYTPSQWANQHAWRIMTPANILNDYDQYLTEDEKDEIADLATVEWE